MTIWTILLTITPVLCSQALEDNSEAILISIVKSRHETEDIRLRCLAALRHKMSPNELVTLATPLLHCGYSTRFTTDLFNCLRFDGLTKENVSLLKEFFSCRGKKRVKVELALKLARIGDEEGFEYLLGLARKSSLEKSHTILALEYLIEFFSNRKETIILCKDILSDDSKPPELNIIALGCENLNTPTDPEVVESLLRIHDCDGLDSSPVIFNHVLNNNKQESGFASHFLDRCPVYHRTLVLEIAKRGVVLTGQQMSKVEQYFLKNTRVNNVEIKLLHSIIMRNSRNEISGPLLRKLLQDSRLSQADKAVICNMVQLPGLEGLLEDVRNLVTSQVHFSTQSAAACDTVLFYEPDNMKAFQVIESFSKSVESLNLDTPLEAILSVLSDNDAESFLHEFIVSPRYRMHPRERELEFLVRFMGDSSLDLLERYVQDQELHLDNRIRAMKLIARINKPRESTLNILKNILVDSSFPLAHASAETIVRLYSTHGVNILLDIIKSDETDDGIRGICLDEMESVTRLSDDQQSTLLVLVGRRYKNSSVTYSLISTIGRTCDCSPDVTNTLLGFISDNLISTDCRSFSISALTNLYRRQAK